MFATNSTERLRIASNGNVSIGNNPTVHADTIFHIEDSGETNVKVEGSTSTLGARISLQNNDTTANAYSQYAFNDAGGQSTSAIQGINTDQTNNYGELAFLTRNAQGTPPQERMRITKDGNLGLGESSSIDARLHVNSGTDNTTLFLESTDGDVNLCMADNAGSCRLLQAGGSLRFRTGGNANAFGTGDSEKMVLDGNGRLLLGTTTEGLATYGENLTIGSVGNAGMTIRTGTGNKGTVYFSDGTSGTDEHKGSIQYDHSDDTLRLASGGTERLRITSDGNIGAGGVTSPLWTTGGGMHLNDNYGIGFGNGGSGRPDFQIACVDGSKLEFRCGFGADTADIVMDTSGRLLIGTTSNSISSSELFEVKSTGSGFSHFRNNSSSYATIYIDNEYSDTGFAPFLTFTDGGGNRGGIGQDQTDLLRITGQGGVSFYTAGTHGGGTEKLRITSDGKVGINETTPEAKLEVRSSDATYALKITNDQNTSGSYNGLSIAGYDENTGSYPFIIVGNSITHETGGNPKFCVRADGNVGINKSSPDHKLDVASSEDSYGIRTTCGIRIDANTSSSKLISTAAGMFYVTASLTSSDDTWFTVAKIQYATGSFTCVVGDASSRNVMTGHFMATIPAYGVSFLSKKESSGAWNTGSSDIQMVNDGSHMAIQVKHNSYYNDSNSAGCYLMLVQCY